MYFIWKRAYSGGHRRENLPDATAAAARKAF